MSNQSISGYDDTSDKIKKTLKESPTSLVIPMTARLSKSEYDKINQSQFQYIAEYIFEIHDNVCPEYINIYYDEIKEDYNKSDHIINSEAVLNIDKLIDFTLNKCMDYKFVSSILTISFYMINDLTHSELGELIDWDKKRLWDFVYTKRPNILDNYRENRTILRHANAILIDRELKQVERFEPHGSYTHMASDALDKLLDISFSKIGYTYFRPINFCPKYSVQSIHHMAKNPLYKDIGYCTIWSSWYMDTRLLNPSKSRNQTVDMIIDMFKKNDEKFIHETIHFYWTNLQRYIELRSKSKSKSKSKKHKTKSEISPKRAIEILYHESIPKLGEEKLLNTKRGITKYRKPKSIFKKILGYVGY